jgi:hypothetical protein
MTDEKSKLLCIQDKCKRCDIGYLIKDYMKPLMQAATVQIREYNMRLIESKCLNNAVLTMRLLLGKHALKHTIYCDVHNVQQRHTDRLDHNPTIAAKLKADLLRKTEKRYIYYIMLTDGYFNKPDGTKVFFPGHVFVLEKIPWGSDVFYYLYQAYIDQYTYAQYIDRYKSIKISRKKAEYYMNKINDLVNNMVWDKDFVDFWKDMTKVDTSHMINGVPENAFFVCYRKIKYESCMKNLEHFVRGSLKLIPEHRDNEIYGNIDIYDDESSPLTNIEMKTRLSKLHTTLQNNLSLQVNNNIK